MKTNKRKVYCDANRYRVKGFKAEILQSKWQALALGSKLFMLSPIAFVLCYRILDDTITVRYFVLLYGSLGVLLYLLAKFVFRKNKSLKFDAWGYIGSFALFAAFCSILNYATLKSDVKVRLIVIKEKSESSLKSGSRACYIFFNENKKRQRFTIDKQLWNSIRTGDQIKMLYQESLLGFDIVKEFEK